MYCSEIATTIIIIIIIISACHAVAKNPAEQTKQNLTV